MLFYNLDTADLTGNEYTDSRLESWDAAFGERQGWSAGLCWPRTAPAGTTGLRRGVNRGGCAEYPEEEGQPRFPPFPPYPAAGAQVRCQTGGTGGTGAGLGWFAVLGGLQRDLNPSVCHDPAVVPPAGGALVLTPSCTHFPGPGWVLGVLGVLL